MQTEGWSGDSHEPAPAFGLHPQCVPPSRLNYKSSSIPLRLWRDTI